MRHPSREGDGSADRRDDRGRDEFPPARIARVRLESRVRSVPEAPALHKHGLVPARGDPVEPAVQVLHQAKPHAAQPRHLRRRRARKPLHLRRVAGAFDDHPVRRYHLGTGEGRDVHVLRFPRPHEPHRHGVRLRGGHLPHGRFFPHIHPAQPLRVHRLQQPRHHRVPVRGAQVPLLRRVHPRQVRQDHPRL